MPSTEIKVKSGNAYPVSYRVVGTLAEMSREQLETLALRQLRTGARAYCQQKLNEAEPAIVVNQEMKSKLIESGMADEEKANAFFAALGKPLEIPSVFEIPISELLPDSPKEGEKARGKKAADIFTLDEPEEAEATE